MIYQHRQVIARGGRLSRRHEAFQEETLQALDDYGSRLIGAWEVIVGREPGCAVWQLRQFASLTDWEEHQERVRQDGELSARRAQKVFPYNDFVDTSIVRLVADSSYLVDDWPSFEEVRDEPSGLIEQRTIYLQPGESGKHHEFYFNSISPVLDEWSRLIGLFDTVIGPGTTNAGSHRSVEIRRYENFVDWENSRTSIESNPNLRDLLKVQWLARIVSVESLLLQPLNYSRIR